MELIFKICLTVLLVIIKIAFKIEVCYADRVIYLVAIYQEFKILVKLMMVIFVIIIATVTIQDGNTLKMEQIFIRIRYQTIKLDHIVIQKMEINVLQFS
jgi:hypothetical protein